MVASMNRILKSKKINKSLVIIYERKIKILCMHFEGKQIKILKFTIILYLNYFLVFPNKLITNFDHVLMLN